MTVVVFPLLRFSAKSPEQTAEEIGNFLQQNLEAVSGFNVVKGFLNLSIQDVTWIETVFSQTSKPEFGTFPKNGQTVVVEYCGPNTNKPLHLGHIRNICLGWSTVNILKANGCKVFKANIYNDRGIAIAKSMVAWQKKANGATPESTGRKGDHLVGDYYVEYGKMVGEEIVGFKGSDEEKKEAEKRTAIFKEVQESLRKWEDGDAETLALWRQMNGWVYEGFEATYRRLGIDFDKAYYESDTYSHGKLCTRLPSGC